MASISSRVSTYTDLNSENDFGLSPLMHASAKGNLAEVNRLLAAGADPNYSNSVANSTALIYAIVENDEYIDIVRALLAAGAEVNHQQDDGLNALMSAAIVDSPATVTILLEAGADQNLRDKDGLDGLDALTYAVLYNHPDIIEILRRTWIW